MTETEAKEKEKELHRLANEFGWKVVKIKPGSGWHPSDGPCLSCGADINQPCKPECQDEIAPWMV